MIPHVIHPSIRPDHGGPGHPYLDPMWCGGCWLEMEGWRHPPSPGIPHTDDCPGCEEADPR